MKTSSRILNRRTFLKASGALATVGTLAGCLRGVGGTDYERTIGFPTAQSGPLAYAGALFIKGARLAIEDVNSESDEEDITLEIADARAEPEQARSVTQEMIENNIPVIAGTVSSDVGAAVANLVEQEEIPYMTVISQNPAITAGKTFSFQFATTAAQGAHGHLQYADHVGAQNYAFLGADFSYPRSVFEGIKAAEPQYNVNVAQSFFTPLGTGDFRSLLNKIDTDTVDMLHLAYPGGNAVVLIEQIKELGLHNEIKYIWGDPTYQSSTLLKPLGRSLLGIGSYGTSFTTEKSRDIQARTDEFIGTYPHFAYDAFYILGTVMNDVGPDPIAIRDTLKEQTFPVQAVGIETDFNEQGRNLGQRWIISKWVEGGGQDKILGDKIPGDMTIEEIWKSDPLPIPDSS